MPVVTLAWGIHTVRTGPLVQPTSVVTTPRANMLCELKSDHELVHGGPPSDHSECKTERRVPPNIIASCHKPISAVSYKHQMPVPAGYTPSRSFAIHQASYVHAGIRVGDENQMTRSELAMLRNIFATYGNENCGGGWPRKGCKGNWAAAMSPQSAMSQLLAMSQEGSFWRCRGQLAVSRQLLELSPGNVTTIIAGLLTTSQKKLAMSQR